MLAVLAGSAVISSTSSWSQLTAALCLSGAVAYLALVSAGRGYDVGLLGDGPVEFQALGRAAAQLAALIMAVAFLTDADVSHLGILVSVPGLMVSSAAFRYAHRRVLHRARRQGVAMKRTVVVGDRDSALRVVHDLSRATYHGFQVEGVCLPEGATDAPTEAGVPVLGAVADVVQVVADRAAEAVVVTGNVLSGEALRRLSWALDRVSARLVVAPDLTEVFAPRLTVRPTAGLSLLEVEVAPPRRRLIVKAVMDRTLGAAALLVALPVILLSGLAIVLTSRGGMFYRQQRVGVDGSTFTMWKLRTMTADADRQRDELRDRNEVDGPLFKIRDDPRVTPVGRVLRRFSIDELPQLFNVLKGDMSLVGPRPPLAEEVAAYTDPAQRRLHVKPGLTGLWQVSGRSDLTWDEAVALDLRYVDNWSVVMDLMILWKTARAVLGSSGAY